MSRWERCLPGLAADLLWWACHAHGTAHAVRESVRAPARDPAGRMRTRDSSGRCSRRGPTQRAGRDQFQQDGAGEWGQRIYQAVDIESDRCVHLEVTCDRSLTASPSDEQNARIEFLKTLQVLPSGTHSLIVDDSGRPKTW